MSFEAIIAAISLASMSSEIYYRYLSIEDAKLLADITTPHCGIPQNSTFNSCAEKQNVVLAAISRLPSQTPPETAKYFYEQNTRCYWLCLESAALFKIYDYCKSSDGTPTFLCQMIHGIGKGINELRRKATEIGIDSIPPEEDALLQGVVSTATIGIILLVWSYTLAPIASTFLPGAGFTLLHSSVLAGSICDQVIPNCSKRIVSRIYQAIPNQAKFNQYVMTALPMFVAIAVGRMAQNYFR